MDLELDAWLDDVWAKRDTLLALSRGQGFVKGRGASAGLDKNSGANQIYRMYSSRSAAISSYEDSHLTAMQRDLDRLERAVNTAPEVQRQDFEYMTLGWMASADIDELRDAFFHYRKAKIGCVYRIYVNAVHAARGRVFRKILVDHDMWGVKGLANSKVSSPDDERVDTIVFYLTDRTATKEALECIASYHQKEPGNFSGILPRLVEPGHAGKYKMHGVGTSMEPPSMRLVSTGGQFYQRYANQSFGAYRSELIFMALERTRLKVEGQSATDRKAAFKSRVARYFRHAGINPDKPARQRTVTGLPSIQTVQDWVNTTDKKFV